MNATTLVYHDKKNPDLELIVTQKGLYAPMPLGCCEEAPTLQEDALEDILVGDFPQDAGDLKAVIVDGVYHKIQQKQEKPKEGLAVYYDNESGDVWVTQGNGVLTGFFLSCLKDDPAYVYHSCVGNLWDCSPTPNEGEVGRLVGYLTPEAYNAV